MTDDSETGLGSKLDEDDKETLTDAIKDTLEFLEDNFDTATKEELDEQREKLSKIAYPITSKLYGAPEGGAPPGQGFDDDDGDFDYDYDYDHDEL